VFASLVHRYVSANAMPWAVLLFACSDSLLWHACEAKPYGVDVFCASLVLLGFSLGETRSILPQLLIFAACAPVLIFLSFPGTFLCGGLIVALLPRVWRERSPRTVIAFGVLVAVVSASFFALALGPVRAQRCAEMTSCWTNQFPPWDEPWRVPVWMTT